MLRDTIPNDFSVRRANCYTWVGNISYGGRTGMFFDSLFFINWKKLIIIKGKSTAIAWNSQIREECITPKYLEVTHWLYVRTVYESVIPWLQVVLNFAIISPKDEYVPCNLWLVYKLTWTVLFQRGYCSERDCQKALETRTCLLQNQNFQGNCRTVKRAQWVTTASTGQQSGPILHQV